MNEIIIKKLAGKYFSNKKYLLNAAKNLDYQFDRKQNTQKDFLEKYNIESKRQNEIKIKRHKPMPRESSKNRILDLIKEKKYNLEQWNKLIENWEHLLL